MGMKPIFEEERQFIKKKSGVEIPEGCWRDASKIYLDCTQDEPMYRIKVHNMQLSVQRTRFQPPAQRTLSDLIEDNKDRLDHLMEWSCSALQNTVLEKPNHFYLIGYSGGKDRDGSERAQSALAGRSGAGRGCLWSDVAR